MKRNYSSIKPQAIDFYLKNGNIAKTAKIFSINKKTLKSWLEKEKIDIKPINVDILGQKYGRLTVLGCVGKDIHHKYIWECQCECGNKKNIRANDLRQGKINSCGCLASEEAKKRGLLFKGVSRNRDLFFGEMSGSYYSRARYNGIKRGFAFFVSKEFLWNLFLNQNRKCALTGVDLEMNKTASLDRKDSCLGYTEENVQWVHKDINKMKLDHSIENFIKWCQLVVDFNNKKL